MVLFPLRLHDDGRRRRRRPRRSVSRFEVAFLDKNFVLWVVWLSGERRGLSDTYLSRQVFSL